MDTDYCITTAAGQQGLGKKITLFGPVINDQWTTAQLFAVWYVSPCPATCWAITGSASKELFQIYSEIGRCL